MTPDEYNLDHERQFGVWINRFPLNCRMIRQEPYGKSWPWNLWIISIWEYRANQMNPATYILPREFALEDGTKLPAGTWCQPKHHLVTDFGSIPPMLQGFPSLSRDRFACQYLLHDTGCRYRGIWVRRPFETVATFQAVSRLDADRLLRQSIGASPSNGNAAQRNMIYAGVRIGAHWGPRDESSIPPTLEH